MKVGLIFARGSNRAFGLNNGLPWYIPQDLEFFKRITSGHAVIMGRNTWESLPQSVRPMPNRINIVVTSERLQSSYKDGVYFVRDIQTALDVAQMQKCYQAWVIGGPGIIKAAEPWAEIALVTYIDYHGEFDVIAPALAGKPWQQVRIRPSNAADKRYKSHDYHIQMWKPVRVLQGAQTYE